jgi:hypothetical protein
VGGIADVNENRFTARGMLPMKSSSWTWLLLGAWAISAAGDCLADAAGGKSLPLDDTIRLGDQALPAEQAVQLSLPPLPGKPGKTIVLRFSMVAYADRAAGCNMNARVELNGTPLGRRTAGGDERLIGRAPTFEFATGNHRLGFSVFSGDRLMVMFAPDVVTGDRMSKDGSGASFAMEIADLARGVDGNTLTIRNERKSTPGKRLDLIVRGIEVGWLDRGRLPKPPDLVPQRAPLKTAVSLGDTRLAWATGGGFSVAGPQGLEIVVETSLGVKPTARSQLIAADSPGTGSGPRVRTEPFGPAGFRTTAEWPGLKLLRSVQIQGAYVEWKERWTNTGDAIRGVPFRHRLFLRQGPAIFWLAGSTDQSMLASTAQNPTLFLQSKAQNGCGFGVAAESDWLRLLLWMRAEGGVGELYSESLALAPGASIDFTLTVTPVRDGGSYWTFINGLRRRWGLNRLCVAAPIFWGFSRAPGGRTPEQTLSKSLGHLGPITLVLGPWLRMEPDARAVTGGRYPRLPADAPRTPGRTADLDVESFLRFTHRDALQEQFTDTVRRMHRTLPQVKVMQMMHPAMEAVYKPLVDRWPYREDAVVTAQGTLFEDGSYNRAWLGQYAQRDWAVLYFVPRPGSTYLQAVLRAMCDSMDRCGGDGIYSDEFSWAFQSRGYSRYDYSRWDGYSVDLDEEGRVLRLKSDNGSTTEAAQLQILGEVLRRGKLFLGNGGPALRSVNSLPAARFAEGGNGTASMAGVHLSEVPLVLGNFGDQKTGQGVFAAVKTCLSMGCVYSPGAVNLLLAGADNFVCKLYPITIRELGPGWIQADERVISSVTRSFPWPEGVPALRAYRYSSRGDLIDRGTLLRPAAAKKLEIVVPHGGLVIAEVARSATDGRPPVNRNP